MRSCLHSSALYPINSGGPDLITCLFPPALDAISRQACLPLDYQEARHPFWGIWDAVHLCWPPTVGDTGLLVSWEICGVLLKTVFILRKPPGAWKILCLNCDPWDKIKIGNSETYSTLLSSSYTITKASAVISYARWALWMAVINNHWFYWGNFWKN